MNIQWEEGDVVFGNLDDFLADLLRRLPAAAAIDDEAARKRLFGSPTGGKDPEADEEWKDVVEPDLEELFQSHVEIVERDLQKLNGSGDEEGEFELRVPGEHLRAWVHTLNQARIALAAKYDINEADMEGRGEFESEEKGFAFLQVEIYGLVFGFLLRHTDL